MVKIDSNCVYVPIKYEGKTIVIVEEGEDVNTHVSQSHIGIPVAYYGDSTLAWVNHQGKVKKGVTYDIYKWSKKKKKRIGTAKYSDDYSSSNYSSNSTSNDISWWEFGHSDEFFLKSLFLLPFRLIAYAVMIPLGIVIWGFIFTYRVIASVFVILVSIIILMPIKIILIIISFGHWDWFEERYIERLKNIWD